MKRPVVLIVEDSLDDRALMQLAIESAQTPFEVVVVEDGQPALDWVYRRGPHAERDAECDPALILLDLNLPELAGLEVLRELRATTLGRRIPVVVLTTSGMPSDIAEAYALGANAYVQKPLEFRDLVRLVEALQAFWLSFNLLPPP